MSVVADHDEIRISTKGMSREQIDTLVDWLRAEVIARKSELTEQQAWELSEEIKSDWWTRNQSRLPE
jgi:hypothetical protein